MEWKLRDRITLIKVLNFLTSCQTLYSELSSRWMAYFLSFLVEFSSCLKPFIFLHDNRRVPFAMMKCTSIWLHKAPEAATKWLRNSSEVTGPKYLNLDVGYLWECFFWFLVFVLFCFSGRADELSNTRSQLGSFVLPDVVW